MYSGAALQASLLAVHCLIDSGGRASVEELATAAAISRRTWHRYFPSKQDCIRPMLHHAATAMLVAMAGRPRDEDVCTSFLASFAEASGGTFAARTRGLMPVVVDSLAFSAAWDHESSLAAVPLGQILADRLQRDIDDALVVALSTTLIALSTSTLRDSAHTDVVPADLLRERVQALGLTHLHLSAVTGERRT